MMNTEKFNEIIRDIIVESVEKAEPFFDRKGEPVLWKYKNWLVDSRRRKKAFISKDHVWTLDRSYIGQYINNMIIDLDGKILAFTKKTDFELPRRKRVKGTTPVVPSPRTIPRFSIPDSVTVFKSKNYFSKLDL